MIAYPISHGKFVNFVAFKAQHELEHTKFPGSWVCSTDKSEFASLFRNWEPEVQALVDVGGKPLKDCTLDDLVDSVLINLFAGRSIPSNH